MKLFVLSDLHSEFYLSHVKLWDKIKDSLPDADVLILAGDIGVVGKSSNEYIALLRKFRERYEKIVLIAGNHEHYRSSQCDVISELTEICIETDVVFLNNSSVIIDGVKFVGSTLWSMADYSVAGSLRDIGKVFKNVNEYNAEHKRCFNFLKSELENPVNIPICIITHHLPSFNLCHPKFSAYGKVNTGFYTEILDKLNLDNVKYWFCGHTHESCVYNHKVDDKNVKIIVNPMGYPGESRDTEVSFDTFDLNIN